MSTDLLLEQIEQSFADRKLSDDERRTFVTALRAANPPEEGLRQLRNAAFEQIRATINDPAQFAALKWLEGIVRSLDVSRQHTPHPESSVYFSPGNGCRNAVLQRLQAARRTVDICVFTISDDVLSQAIVDTHQRGVRVRVVTDDEKAFDAGSDIQWLRNAGVPLAVDQSSAHMHHKYAVVDGSYLLNGSYNWTRSASTVNEENLVVCNDPHLVGSFTQRFEALWLRWAS
ncbi:phospholipase D-like domain-containing protein [Chitinibacteraceae bacterium HSL-7]